MCSVEDLTDEKTLSAGVLLLDNAVQLHGYLGESLQPIFYPVIYTDLFSCSMAGATFSLCHDPVPPRLSLYGYKYVASLSPLLCTALYRGGVMTTPAPGSNICE